MQHKVDPVDCQEWQAKLDMLLDGELTSEEQRAVDSHVRGCPFCASEMLRRTELKRTIRAAGRAFSSRTEFRQMVNKAVAAKSPSRRIYWRWQIAVPALCLLLIAMSVMTYFFNRELHRDQAYREVADLHVSALASTNPVDVISTDRHTVKPWFQGKLPFTFNLPELQNSEFSLLGGRVTYLEQTPGAHLVYRLRNHDLSVFIFQADRLPESLPELPAETKDSFSMQSWTQSGLRYFVIGDAGVDDIQRLSAMFKKAAGS